ncbi:exported hypothetical protein [Frigoribacterium sp. 9N]|nr:exported hypothetical protein [Frigoribacterium sp. 9N]
MSAVTCIVDLSKPAATSASTTARPPGRAFAATVAAFTSSKWASASAVVDVDEKGGASVDRATDAGDGDGSGDEVHPTRGIATASTIAASARPRGGLEPVTGALRRWRRPRVGEP